MGRRSAEALTPAATRSSPVSRALLKLVKLVNAARPGSQGRPGRRSALEMLYQYWVVAPELRRTGPAPSGRSKTDWTAIRPGPSRVSQVDLA